MCSSRFRIPGIHVVRMILLSLKGRKQSGMLSKNASGILRGKNPVLYLRVQKRTRRSKDHASGAAVGFAEVRRSGKLGPAPKKRARTYVYVTQVVCLSASPRGEKAAAGHARARTHNFLLLFYLNTCAVKEHVSAVAARHVRQGLGLGFEVSACSTATRMERRNTA